MSDLEAIMNLRIAVIEKAWSDLKTFDEFESAYDFFQSSRFEWWSGGGLDFDVPRAKAKVLFEKTKRRLLDYQRANLRSPQRVGAALDFFTSGRFDRLYAEDLDIDFERSEAQRVAVPPKSRSGRPVGRPRNREVAQS